MTIYKTLLVGLIVGVLSACGEVVDAKAMAMAIQKCEPSAGLRYVVVGTYTLEAICNDGTRVIFDKPNVILRPKT